MKEKKILIILLVTAVALGGLTIYTRMTKDREAPKITIQKDVKIGYQEGMSEKELLKGVTAKDNKDGDLTDKVFVDRISVADQSDTATVYYVVIDSSNNVTRVTRKIPIGAVSEETDAETQTAEQTAESETSTAPVEGIYPADPATYGEGKPVIQVKNQRNTVKQGTAVNLMEFIENYYSPSGEDEENRKFMASHTSIKIDGNSVGIQYTAKDLGEKTVSYLTVDKNGNYSATTEMTLVVE